MKRIFSLLLLACYSVTGQLPVIPYYANVDIGARCVNSNDDQTSYTEGTNVNGENGGVCWSGAYVTHLF